ncbi:TrbI/VirB10 family protein [Sphingobium sp. SJ10-10]|uniref:TrbI/VirB10 family protein n=1 Tax=Sphingobium sp. SJ10-10 TaxID=3114999 RepID=UPI002E191E41|nr:TrbI/VirB10 family protein [Sphingobium sp. SJ10-10]
MTEGPSPDRHDIRPLVAGASGNRGVWIFASAITVAAVILFATLENHRQTITAPTIGPMNDQSAAAIASSPDLFIPPATIRASSERPGMEQLGSTTVSQAEAEPTNATEAPSHQPRSRPAATPRYQQNVGPQVVSYPPTPYVPPLSPQTNYAAGAPRPIIADRGPETGNQADRVRASSFVNPSMTVPKGTLITAVLETALDSTRSGYARAIISRDVFGFDGSRVLIPKGSRLIGEYKADLAPGQKRALIQWQRLMRPDGAVISLDSPAADPLGRAGVEGKVNSHFFERFGGAILQSVLSVGSQVAANKISDGAVIYAIPVPGQAVPIASPDKVQPTLKVRQGKSISVFVAKDLDFSTVER